MTTYKQQTKYFFSAYFGDTTFHEKSAKLKHHQKHMAKCLALWAKIALPGLTPEIVNVFYPILQLT